ncbi:hypothetical protein [Curtobacterium sp. RRHDQ10]|uniref:hypothetical protein n=1 Tax=Curtobacterium phyllosphaerae TaxID=3413379 RepID=UPI003BF0B220
MSNLVVDTVVGLQIARARGLDAVIGRTEVSRDRFVVVILAIAIILAAGIAVAWWAACQSKGLYPALDMPSWNAGGTWKAYCKK